MPADIPAPLTAAGLAQIETCPDRSNGTDADGDPCDSCYSNGFQIWRACPRCGDLAFDYINGHDEADGMRCRLACGYQWTSADPGWQIQRSSES